MTSGKTATGAKWTTLPYHRRWLVEQASGLFDFFEVGSIDPNGGFFDLDDAGRPIGEATVREIHVTTRTVHCFAIARLQCLLPPIVSSPGQGGRTRTIVVLSPPSMTDAMKRRSNRWR